jgi:hypothetical protein
MGHARNRPRAIHFWRRMVNEMNKKSAQEILDRINGRIGMWEVEREVRRAEFKNGEGACPLEYAPAVAPPAPEREMVHRTFVTPRAAPSPAPDGLARQLESLVEMLGEEIGATERKLAETLRAEFGAALDALRAEFGELKMETASLRVAMTTERSERLRAQLDRGGSVVDRRMN